MDPLEQALIDKYQMTPDLARRVAVGLRQPNAATDAYPAVAGMVSQQTPSAPRQPAFPIHPAALAPTPQQLQQAQQPDWNAQMQASQMLQQKHQANQRSQRENDLAIAQSEQDAIDQQLRQKRVQHYNTLIQQTQQGKDIGKENRAWLQQVHAASQYTPPSQSEDAVLRSPGGEGYGAPTTRAYADKMIGAALDGSAPGVPAFAGAPAFASGLNRGVNDPAYQGRQVDLKDLLALGVDIKTATNFLYPQGR